MNSFKKKCVDYLINNGWEQDINGYAWSLNIGRGGMAVAETLGGALDIQLEWDDEYDADTRMD